MQEGWVTGRNKEGGGGAHLTLVEDGNGGSFAHAEGEGGDNDDVETRKQRGEG